MVEVISSTREYSDGPRTCPSEPDGVKFRSNAELDAYAEKNGLCIVAAPTRRKSTGCTSYKFHKELGEVMEVGFMRNVEALAREVQEKHPEYSWVKCLRIAKKALQKEAKGNEKG